MSISPGNQEKLQQIRKIHSEFLAQQTNISDFLKFLSKLKQINNTHCLLAVASAIYSAIIFDDITNDLHHFAKCFSFLVTSSDEVVRRSCLQIIALLVGKSQLDAVFRVLLPLFKDQWSERAQEMMLSFAFSFSPPVTDSFQIFIPTAENFRKSSDELLASTATDFIIYLKASKQNPNAEKDNEEPKAVLLLRSTIDFKKIHENIPSDLDDFADDFIEDFEDIPRPTSTRSNQSTTLASKQPIVKTSLRRNTNKQSDDEAPKSYNDSFENEDYPEEVLPPEPNYDEFDENTEPPPGKSLLCNSIDLRKVLKDDPSNNTRSKLKDSPLKFSNDSLVDDDDEFELKQPPKKQSGIKQPKTSSAQRSSKNESEHDAFDESPTSSPSRKSKIRPPNLKGAKSGSSNIPATSNSSRRSQGKASKRDDDDLDDDFLEQDPSAKPPKTAQVSTKRASYGGTNSGNGTPTSPKRKSGPQAPAVPISTLSENLRSKDWEKQQSAVDGLGSNLENDPTALSVQCKEIWLNLIDAASSPRTMLSHQALQFADKLYSAFASTLCLQTSQWITLLLNYTCSSHQFLADDATACLLTIADNSPRNRVFSSMMSGLKHKNSIARGRAIQCLSILSSQGNLEDKELKSMIQNIAPLTRDTRAETRDSAKRTLKELIQDERFSSMAKTSLSSQDYTDLKKCIGF